jgi:hypothetical protein
MPDLRRLLLPHLPLPARKSHLTASGARSAVFRRQAVAASKLPAAAAAAAAADERKDSNGSQKGEGRREAVKFPR